MQLPLYDGAMLHILSITLTALSLSVFFMIARHSSVPYPWEDQRDSQKLLFFGCDWTKRHVCTAVHGAVLLSLLFRDLLEHSDRLVLTFPHAVRKEYAIYPDLDIWKYFQTSLNGHSVSWFLSHPLLALISPVVTCNKSLSWWLAFKLSLSCP